MPTFVGLLRGINVGGHNKVPMAELRRLCGDELGWSDVRTYIQSGNVVFWADEEPERLEADLERAIEARFGISIHVIVRTAAAWADYAASNPFPAASREAPNLVFLSLSKEPPNPDAADRLRERATNDERIEQIDDALWTHFPYGAGKSKLAPALTNRLVGSPVTARNWRTVLKLEAMAADAAS